MVEALLRAVDAGWKPIGGEPFHLRILGSTALFLQTDYRRGTKDSDVLEAADLPPRVAEQLIALAGQQTDLHRQHRIYLDIVGRALPFLPEEPLWRSKPDLHSGLVHFSVDVLDVIDVVVTKLWRNHANDRGDIEAMVARGLVPHDRLVDRFRSAVSRFWLDARADDLPRAVAALNRLERDALGVPESQIDLPPGVED